MDYNQLFNSNYINEEQYRQLLMQRDYIEQKIKHDQEQQVEFAKMLHSLNDFLDSYNKIDSQYKQQANKACICVICSKLFENK